MRTKALAVVSVVLLGTLGLAGVAKANCNPGRSPLAGNFHVGWWTGGSSSNRINGSSANILVTSPYTYSDSMSTAWVMLQGDSYYGQVGWLKYSGDVWDFWQVNDSAPGIYFGTFGQPTIHNSPQYKVTYSSSSFHFFKNNTAIHTQNVNGYSGNDASETGEVTNIATQMPGTRGYHVVFQNVQVRSSGGWYDAGGEETNIWNEYFGVTSPNAHRIEIWDKACA